jgi:hypothetical protein
MAANPTDAAGPVVEPGASAPSQAVMAVDVCIVRPVSIVGLFLGTAVAIVATPFALMSGTTDQVYKKLVVEPFDFAMRRPLGEKP